MTDELAQDYIDRGIRNPQLIEAALAINDDRLHEAGWQRTDHAALRHYDTDPAHTPPPERREWLYVPVARR